MSPLLVMAVPGAIRYWQPAVSRSLPGRTNQRPAISFSVVSRCFLPADRRAAAAWALAFAKAAGMCLMNGSLRFRVSFVLIVLLFAGGSRLFVSLYMEQQATYKQLVEDEEQKERELSDNLTNFANHLRIFRYSPRTDGFLYGCKEEEMVNSIQYNVWNAPEHVLSAGW